jgi:uncharacterized protein YjeT (DUF2065 family)
MQNDDLDDLFAAARSAAPRPSPALLSRIEGDGLRLLPHAATRAPMGLRGLAGRMLRAVGGLAGAAGLATAALAGVWVGFAQPQGLNLLTEALAGTPALDRIELIPSLDPFSVEG